MGQSLIKNYIHITFSTKNRNNLITEDIEEELYNYIGGICKNLKCNPLKIGGYKNHVHILCLLHKNVALSNLIEKIKSHSSKWIKTKGDKFKIFYWQNGYGSFSVNPREVNKVVDYIKNQKEHHRTKGFQEEFLLFLKNYEIEFDEKYIWD